jgi:hypothetical protein
MVQTVRLATVAQLDEGTKEAWGSASVAMEEVCYFPKGTLNPRHQQAASTFHPRIEENP